MEAQTISLMIYNFALMPIIFLSLLFISFGIINLFIDKKPKKYKAFKKLPFISVQIPTFNDPIAARCVDRCMKFDYPKDRYEIIIVDDSTNKQTQELLSDYANKHKGFVKYTHRTNREGFKPGALNKAMSITKGEILVVFDSDWLPKPDFLKEVIKPFSDPRVAIVQTTQGFYNRHTNIITRFAAYLLMIFHTIIMPINNKLNTVFFCGTAGAIRRSAFEEVGGWNKASITEDSELSVRLIMKGYTTIHMDYETQSEVPDTYESFIKQQMRWCYGNVRVFIDNAKLIWTSKALKLQQKLMISFLTTGHFSAPLIIIMTFFGLASWFLGEPELFQIGHLYEFFARFAYTIGYFILGALTLYHHKVLKEFPYFIFTAFTMGLVISVSNAAAFYKAVRGKNLHWFCTPKIDNDKAI